MFDSISPPAIPTNLSRSSRLVALSNPNACVRWNRLDWLLKIRYKAGLSAVAVSFSSDGSVLAVSYHPSGDGHAVRKTQKDKNRDLQGRVGVNASECNVASSCKGVALPVVRNVSFIRGQSQLGGLFSWLVVGSWYSGP